ncbi:GNAT family N-acetyltransferase [Lactococcus chungangensis]|jgi:ABC-type ATPase involved in cell division/GNAT superfamily N-acetyltransferase|uniref:GNAT family N-acetyltransferase n=1 Tax=Pseudolactococcus chungangensis TaxID=451457 RepID=UPI0028D5C487|nr:GNAT family N-acetyltransferase [Lactococcus chungangensis]
MSRVDEVIEIFGLTEEKIKRRKHYPQLSDDIVFDDKLTYITGFSGVGKTSLIKNLILKDDSWYVPRKPTESNLPIIELVGDSVSEAISILTKVGLSEAFIFITPYEQLSEGQKARFILADAINRNKNKIIIDEFLSNVDRLTAKNVARTFQKQCRNAKISVILVSAHEDIIAELLPDMVLELDFLGKFKKIDRDEIEYTKQEFQIMNGTHEEYSELKDYHYFGELSMKESKESYNTEYFVIKDRERVIGTIIYREPYPKALNFLAAINDINKEIGWVGRTIIHPSYRGLGLSLQLLNTSMYKKKYRESRSILGYYMPRHLSAGYMETNLVENKDIEIRKQFIELIEAKSKLKVEQLRDDRTRDLFLESLSDEEQNRIAFVGSKWFRTKFLEEIKYYFEIRNKKMSCEMFEEIVEFVEKSYSNVPIDVSILTAIPYKLRGFVYINR